MKYRIISKFIYDVEVPTHQDANTNLAELASSLKAWIITVDLGKGRTTSRCIFYRSSKTGRVSSRKNLLH